ncbi:MAG: hypothetical protein U0531_10200 [Dehalococcoidia bacterium]
MRSWARSASSTRWTRALLVASLGVRNLEGYNKHPKVVERLPQWVVIIDELADLMMAACV